jgi:hypothetical protein
VRCFASGRSAKCYCPKPFPDLCRPISADDYRCAEQHVDCGASVDYDADPPFARAERYVDDSYIQVD